LLFAEVGDVEGLGWDVEAFELLDVVADVVVGE